MNDEHCQVELTSQQCEMLLRGLRFLRSEALLDMRDPVPGEAEQREQQVREIESLATEIRGGLRTGAAATV